MESSNDDPNDNHQLEVHSSQHWQGVPVPVEVNISSSRGDGEMKLSPCDEEQNVFISPPIGADSCDHDTGGTSCPLLCESSDCTGVDSHSWSESDDIKTDVVNSTKKRKHSSAIAGENPSAAADVMEDEDESDTMFPPQPQCESRVSTGGYGFSLLRGLVTVEGSSSSSIIGEDQGGAGHWESSSEDSPMVSASYLSTSSSMSAGGSRSRWTPGEPQQHRGASSDLFAERDFTLSELPRTRSLGSSSSSRLAELTRGIPRIGPAATAAGGGGGCHRGGGLAFSVRPAAITRPPMMSMMSPSAPLRDLSTATMRRLQTALKESDAADRREAEKFDRSNALSYTAAAASTGSYAAAASTGSSGSGNRGATLIYNESSIDNVHSSNSFASTATVGARVTVPIPVLQNDCNADPNASRCEQHSRRGERKDQTEGEEGDREDEEHDSEAC